MNLKPVYTKKIAIFTDLHFGKKSNSKIHNQDCLDYVNWFCDNVRNNKSITHISFMGDWFESRSAINIETLDFSRKAVQELDKLGLPIYFIVGNHDLHRRTSRDVHSVKIFEELKNFIVIDKPTVIDNILYCPYIFEHEYEELALYTNLWAWLGHFEFKNFYITGYNTLAIHGASHESFKNVKQILSGHFHKRQSKDNVCFIGNCFPMDYGDAGDEDRGMAVYTTEDNSTTFINWTVQPTYLKINLGDIYKCTESNIFPFKNKMRVKCVADVPISYLDSISLKDEFIKTFGLRDFLIEDSKTLLIESNDIVDTTEYNSVDDIVVKELCNLKEDKSIKIDTDLLASIYKSLEIKSEEE